VVSYSATASVSKTAVSRRGSVSVSARVTAAAAGKVLVDVEIISPSGNKVFQKAYDKQSFSAGQTRTFTPSWTVPGTAEKGVYTVKVGVFVTGWGTLYYWNDSAASFTVN
jgi:hypothetical protein